MEKILKKYSTIPPHLYVKRTADKQLAQIIDEMQRPGYVLVARQMGKTNLLLNAIRELKGENKLFAYVDLSNNFLEERDCYRNIIDNILEPNEDLFHEIISEIHISRSKKLLPPHKEYSQELRQILKIIKGNLIIILDEIDALRSVGYSDHIFAQIRSNYFARTNFPEFNHLTYILSGVIEPTDLIKDKNKSPFNIGEKIYLDDFTLREHQEFIEKGHLGIDESISLEIYSWTNGNPRLTFDICSEIEDLIIAGVEVTSKSIYELISKKYFIQYDVAPIDHIRDIVSKNKVIRKAVSNIQRGRDVDSIEVKRKLYLYGIIDSKFDAEKVEIKNKIIKRCLSSEWIDSIERQNQDLFAIGLEKIDNLEFSEAISILEEYLTNSEVPAINQQISGYNIGYAYFKLGKLTSALTFFSKFPFNKESTKHHFFYYGSMAMSGVCNIELGNIDEGNKLFEQVIQENPEGFPYNTSLLNLARYSKQEREYEKSLDLIEKLLTSISVEETVDNLKLRVLGYTLKAQIFLEQNKVSDALVEIDTAIATADDSDVLELLFFKYSVQELSDKDLLIRIARDIIDKEIPFNKYDAYDVSFNELNLYRYLLALDISGLTELFSELLEYSSNMLFQASSTRTDILFILAEITRDNEQKLKFLYEIQKLTSEEDATTLIKVYRQILLHDKTRAVAYEQTFNKFLLLFNATDNQVEVQDITVFAYLIKLFSDKRQLDYALHLCQTIEARISNSNEEVLHHRLVIYYWFANIYFSKRDLKNAITYSEKTLDIIEKTDEAAGSLLDERGIKLISDQVKQIKSSSRIQTPVRKPKKYGRNDVVKVRYIDNSVKEGKYKRFEADILGERCHIED